jgi:hypothetical protein
MFLHRIIHKYTWSSAGGKTHNQIYHALISKRRHSNIVDCDNDHILVVAKVRERLSVSKRAVQKLDIERFRLKNLNDVAKNTIKLKSQTVLWLWKTRLVVVLM